RVPEHPQLLVPRPKPGWSLPTGNMTTTTTAGTHHWATNPRPATPPAAPTAERSVSPPCQEQGFDTRGARQDTRRFGLREQSKGAGRFGMSRFSKNETPQGRS